jgi:hypothetical protein
MMTAPPTWTTEALCQGLATPERDPWHPDAEPVLSEAVARHICAVCPVRLECLHEGLGLLTRTSVKGMWGGLTPEELRKLAKAKGLPARKVADHGTRGRYVSHGCRCDPCVRANAAAEHGRRLAGDEVGNNWRSCAGWTWNEHSCKARATGDSPYCAHHDTSDGEASAEAC